MSEGENQQAAKRRKRDRRVEGTRLLKEADALIDQGKLVLASTKLREGVDLYCHAACHDNLGKIIMAVTQEMTMDDWQRLYTDIINGSASAQYFASYMCHLCAGGWGLTIRIDELPCFKTDGNDFLFSWWREQLILVCEQGHGYAMFIRGILLIEDANHSLIGDGELMEQAMVWFRKAELLGVAEASARLMDIYCTGSTPSTCYRQAMVHAKRGAQWNNGDCIARMNDLVLLAPRESTPWSQWTTEYHWTCMEPVRHAIKTWMLVSNRQKILPRGVAMIVNEFICTETEDERFCKKWWVE